MLNNPRWLIYVFIIFIGIVFAATSAVFGVQVADRPVCLSLVDNNSRRKAIYDPFHGQILPETRYSTPIYWLSEDGYRLVTQLHLYNPGLYSLTLLPPEGEPIVLEEAIYLTRNNGFNPRASWSPDKTRLAYIWSNAERESYITIFSMQDHSKQTAFLRNEERVGGTLWLGPWSADGAFIDIRVLGNQPVLDFYGLWSVEDMQLMPLDFEFTLINASSVWSSTGHQLAVLMQSLGEETFRLYIVNPEDPENPIHVPLNLSDAFVERVYAVAWSANDAYLMVAKQRTYRVDNGRTLTRQWFYNIYASDGTPVEVDIAGKTIESSPNTRLFVPGFWSYDGQRWIFLQDTFEEADVTTRLMAYDSETGAYDLLEDGVVSELYEHMLALPFIFTSNAAEAVVPVNRRLLLPYWRDDTITLDYIDYENDARITLIEGAQELILDFVDGNLEPSAGLGFFVIPWRRDTEMQATVFSRDDGQVLAEIPGINEANEVSWLGDDWLSFIVLRDGIRGLELLDVKTGVHHRLLEGHLDEENIVFGTISPDKRHVELVVLPGGSYTGTERGQLYLVSLESGEAQLVHDEAVPYGVWSPDGSALAFMRPGAHNGLGVQVVSASGTTIGDTDIPVELGSGMRSIYMWSNCDANPTPE